MKPTPATCLSHYLFLSLLLSACATPAPPLSATPPGPTATPLSGWAALIARSPYPFGTPLPPAEPTALDGTYVKTHDDPSTPVPCRRCPDYMLHGGIWRLRFHQGAYHILHEATEWKSLGSYTVDGETLALFNDPNCIDTTGRYTWTLAEGVLTLTEVDDACAIRLRAMNLTFEPWAACQPPNPEAAISGHWPVPLECEGQAP